MRITNFKIHCIGLTKDRPIKALKIEPIQLNTRKTGEAKRKNPRTK